MVLYFWPGEKAAFEDNVEEKKCCIGLLCIWLWWWRLNWRGRHSSLQTHLAACWGCCFEMARKGHVWLCGNTKYAIWFKFCFIIGTPQSLVMTWHFKEMGNGKKKTERKHRCFILLFLGSRFLISHPGLPEISNRKQCSSLIICISNKNMNENICIYPHPISTQTPFKNFNQSALLDACGYLAYMYFIVEKSIFVTALVTIVWLNIRVSKLHRSKYLNCLRK